MEETNTDIWAEFAPTDLLAEAVNDETNLLDPIPKKDDLDDLEEEPTETLEELEPEKIDNEPSGIESEDEPVLTPEPEDEGGGKEEVEEEDLFSVLTNEFANRNLFDVEEGEVLNEEAFFERVESRIDQRVEEEVQMFKDQLPLDGQELLDHLSSGGTVRDFVEVYQAPDYSNLSIEKDTDQRNVLREYFRLRGETSEDIEDRIEFYETTEKLEEKAQKAKENLIKYQNQQKEELKLRQKQESENRERVRQETIQRLDETITKSDNIKGFPLGRKAKKELLSYLTEAKVKYKDPNTGKSTYITQFMKDELEASNDPQDVVLRALLRMTNFDTSSLLKKKETSQVKRLEKTLRKSKSNRPRSTGRPQNNDDDIWNNI